MSNLTQPASTNARESIALRKLPFTHGIEVENFITNKRGDILEDGKELVAVWDQMFNGAFDYFRSLTSSSTNVPDYIRAKIKGVSKKDVERHGKIIRYVQLQYVLNGSSISINIFGPDPNISQITWLLELVTPPCEYIEELDWWINTLYLAASQSITKGYFIQPIGFNPFQSEYRAGVTCGEHHHLGGFKNKNQKFEAYNMIRAYIPHLIAIASTSPFINGQPAGRIILKKGEDNRTLILAPDCTRSIRLRENSGQLGPNIPEYLPHLTPNYTQQQFSRHVRKEIPDDRYVDVSPFTSYGTIECRFFDTQYDQGIRIAIIILLQALALKGSKYANSDKKIPEIRGNTLYEHRKRAVNFGMIAKFQGDPSIESVDNIFAKYYNHNPENGGPPGKIFESIRALLIWLKPEFKELQITEQEIEPLLTMLWGTQRIAPPISASTFMLYLYEQNQNNISNMINSLGLLNGRPRRIFCEYLGRPSMNYNEFFDIKASQPTKSTDTTKSSLARKLQQDSKSRRKTAMAKERMRLKIKQEQIAKLQREKMKKERELEQKKLERMKLLEQAKKPPPKPTALKTSTSTIPLRKVESKTISQRSIPTKPIPKKPISKPGVQIKKANINLTRAKKPIKKQPNNRAQIQKAKTTISTRSVSKPIKKVKTKRKKYVITEPALQKVSNNSIQNRNKNLAYASTATTRQKSQNITIPKTKVSSIATSSSLVNKSTIKSQQKVMKSTTKYKDTQKVSEEDQFFRESKFVSNFNVYNLPTKLYHSIFVPVIKIKWTYSVIRSKSNYSLKAEAEFIPKTKKNSSKGKIYQENIILEKASLRDSCFLAIPIDLSDYIGEFQIRLNVYDQRTNKLLLSTLKSSVKEQIPKDKNHKINSLSLPANQAGDTKINISINTSKKNLRGKITLYGIGQRGIVKLYEKKSRFSGSRFSLDLPITIPLSICSSHWYIHAIFNAQGVSCSAIAKSPPPLSKLINISLIGNPPLKPNIKPDYRTEITPKVSFKENSSIREIGILQILDGKQSKVLKKYRLKTRIKKNENFVLESFEWKPPSMRKGLFRKHKRRIVTFHCRIIDEIGLISDSLIGLVETPSVSVYP